MNLLLDDLPYSVEVNGKRYKINADFRTCLRVIMAFEDNDLTNYERQVVVLANMFPIIPQDTRTALEKAVLFLDGGEMCTGANGKPRVYSFQKDGNLIFSAFRQTHGIDLKTAKLHWWEFLALFMDVGNDTAFCGLVSMRQRYKTGKMSKEERRAVLEMGDLFDIQETDERTNEQIEAERRYDEAIAEGMRKRANATNYTNQR